MDRLAASPRRTRFTVATLVAVALVVVGTHPAHAPNPSTASAIIPPGREAAITALLSDVGFDAPRDGGNRWRNVRIERSTVMFALARETSPGAWAA